MDYKLSGRDLVCAPNLHKFLIYLAQDTGYHGSEVTTERWSRCGVWAWPLVASWFPSWGAYLLVTSSTLAESCLCTEAAQFLLRCYAMASWKILYEKYEHLLRDIYQYLPIGSSGSWSKLSICKATFFPVGRKKSQLYGCNNRILIITLCMFMLV